MHCQHILCMDAEYKFEFEAVLGRIKQALQLSTDAQVAELIGMSPSGLGNRKRSGSIPFENICRACAARGVNIDWVLTGIGAPLKTELILLSRAVPYDADLMSEITREVWIAFENKDLAEREPDILATVGFRAAVATLIFNRVCLERSPKLRTAMIREEAVIHAYAERFRARAAAGSSARADLPDGSDGSDGSA